MIKRALVWAVFLLVVWALLHFGSKVKNPWSMPANPVLSALPVPGAGCGENCK